VLREENVKAIYKGIFLKKEDDFNTEDFHVTVK